MFYIYIKSKDIPLSMWANIFTNEKILFNVRPLYLRMILILRMLLMFECAAIECLAKKKLFIFLIERTVADFLIIYFKLKILME